MHLNTAEIVAHLQGLDRIALAVAGVTGLVCYVAAKQWPMGKGYDRLPVEPVKSGGLIGLLLGHMGDEMNNVYGDVFALYRAVHAPDPFKRVARLRNMRHNWLVTAHPSDIEHIQVTNADNYTKPIMYDKLLGRILGDGILTQTNIKQHAFHRRTMAPAFSPRALKSISDNVMAKHGLYLIQNLRKRVQEGKAFLVQEDISEATVQVMAEAVFKTKTLEDTKYLVGVFNDLAAYQWNFLRLLPGVDSLLCFSNYKINQGLKVLAARANRIAEEVRKEGLDANNGAPQALVDYLIFSGKYSPKHILDHSVTFILAGHDTTNNSLHWMSYLMAKNPGVQEKLYEALVDTIGKNKQCTLEDLKSCTYLTNCVKETLRVRGVVSCVTKVAVSDDVLPGTKTFIPKGTEIDCQIYTCLHNKDVWGADAEEFRPERWEEIPEEKRALCELSFIPFSSGRRGCIGRDFAMNEMHLLAAAMFRNFEFTWPDDEPEPVPIQVAVVRPIKQMRFNIKERPE